MIKSNTTRALLHAVLVCFDRQLSLRLGSGKIHHLSDLASTPHCHVEVLVQSWAMMSLLLKFLAFYVLPAPDDSLL